MQIIKGQATALLQAAFLQQLYEDADTIKKEFLALTGDSLQAQAKKIFAGQENVIEKIRLLFEQLTMARYTYAFEYLQYKQKIKVEAETKKSLESMRQSCNNFNNKVGVFCLTDKYDAQLMWAHYANNHAGFCVEYDFTKPMNSIFYMMAQNMLFPVSYAFERPSLHKIYHDGNFKEKYLFSLLCKDSVWRYENEWRILGIFSNKEDEQRKLIVPKPTKLILGSAYKNAYFSKDKKAKHYRSHLNRIVQIAEDKNIPIYKMQVSEGSYDLNMYPFSKDNDLKNGAAN